MFLTHSLVYLVNRETTLIIHSSTLLVASRVGFQQRQSLDATGGTRFDVVAGRGEDRFVVQHGLRGQGVPSQLGQDRGL
jgi:hypothetical protein